MSMNGLVDSQGNITQPCPCNRLVRKDLWTYREIEDVTVFMVCCRL